MPSFSTNIQIIRPTRKKPQRGDIFAIHLIDGRYLFGRVMDSEIEADLAPMPGAYLIYVYDVFSESPDVDPRELVPERLLVPPVFINKLPWTKGYFMTVDHQDLADRDWLRRVSFWDAARSEFLDQRGRPVGHEVQPCGDWALMSYRWLDDQISDALGIPRVPEDI